MVTTSPIRSAGSDHGFEVVNVRAHGPRVGGFKHGRHVVVRLDGHGLFTSVGLIEHPAGEIGG